jgi:transposase
MPQFRDYDQRQGVFRQFVPERLLEEQHPARIVDLVVERLDLNSVYAVYGEEGNVAYHAKMMLKVLFYSYLCGVMSCRKMEDGLEYRADFMYLSGDQVPDFRTLNNFRVRHMARLPELFSQIVLLCGALGMVDFKHLGIDGQKIAACSHFRNNVARARAQRQLKRVKRGMEKLLNEEPNDYATEEQLGNRRETLKRKKEKLEAALKELESLEDEQASVNLTDKDAKIMSHKDGRIVPSYNHQSAVDGKYGITCAVQTTQNTDMPEDLFPLVDEASKNADGQFETVLADSGFCAYDTLVEMEGRRKEPYYVPDRRFECEKEKTTPNKFGKARFRRQEDGSMICPAGHPMKQNGVQRFEDGHTRTYYRGTKCPDCELFDQCKKSTYRKYRRISIDSREEYRQQMRERLNSREGKHTYQKRQGIVEPPHGHDQKNLGWRQHRIRGLTKAAAEFQLIRIAMNIGKIARYRAAQLYRYARDAAAVPDIESMLNGAKT